MAAPIFLYTGPEAGEKNNQILLQKDALKKKFGAIDDFVYYGTDLNMSDVVAQLMTESLFTPATFVLIRSAELIKDKKDIDLLAEWIKTAENKDGSTVLVLASDELKVDSKLEKIVPPANRRVFWEMFENRKEQWLYSFFKKNGYSIDSEAVSSILDMVENNTEELRSECSRFFMCFPAGHTVTEYDVEQILSHNRAESAFTLFDAMAAQNSTEKRLESSLLILQKIRLSKKDSDAVVILAGLLYCFRKLLLWHSIHSGHTPDEIELKKNGFSSKTARSQYSQAGKIWTAAQTAAIIALLSKTDMDIRSLGSALQDTLLVLAVYEIIVKNGAYCSLYEPA